MLCEVYYCMISFCCANTNNYDNNFPLKKINQPNKNHPIRLKLSSR